MPVSAGKRGVLGSAATALVLAVAGLLILTSSASAANPYTADTTPYTAPSGSKCPPIANKPDQIPHVDYQGVEHITYCYGPIRSSPGQNVIRLNPTNLLPHQPGYITRFDPELVYTERHGAPRGRPAPAPRGLGRQRQARSSPSARRRRSFRLPAGLRLAKQADGQLVPQRHAARPGRAAGAGLHRLADRLRPRHLARGGQHAHGSHRMDGRRRAEPGWGSRARSTRSSTPCKGWGTTARYTFPDQATGGPARSVIGPNQTWTPSHPVTLIGTAGHLHPGGLDTSSRPRAVTSATRSSPPTPTTTSRPARSRGTSRWAPRRRDWRVQVQAGDTVERARDLRHQQGRAGTR